MSGAVIYSRVSTDEQAKEGWSLEAQEERCRQYAQTYDLQVAGIVRDDGYSAATLDRPGLTRLLKLDHADAVIVTKLDRLTRSVPDLCRLLEVLDKRGMALHGVNDKLDTSTASGMLLVNIMASVAQWEREVIGERVRDTLRHIRHERGGHVGRPPWGWQVANGDGPGASLSPPPPDEVRAMQLARDMSSKGKSLRVIGNVMFGLGYAPSAHPENVRRILRSPLPEEMIEQSPGIYRWPATM